MSQKIDNHKTWIMTRRAGFNFGSSLQAYAMTYIVSKLGYPNEIINFEEYRLRGKFRLFVFDCFYWFSKVIPNRLIPSSIYSKYVESHNQRKKFADFEKQYFPLTPKKYKNSAALINDAAKCEVILCGSDQIWSPLHLTPAFFLDFVDASKTKAIAYAPSIGVNTVANHREEMAQLINRIPYISVREKRGAEIIKELTGRDAQVLLDPTFLLNQNEWSKLVEPTQEKEPYIICYFLTTDLVPIDFITDLQKKTGYKLINLITNYSNTFIPNAENICLSPTGFLGYISEAAYICTNSFHGTIFSIQFCKKFFVFGRFKETDSACQNSRIHTLLESLELKDRFVDIETKSMSTQHLEDIDYTQSNNQLTNKREVSLEYLKTSLEKVIINLDK